jgi:sporulation protein YabP
MHTLSLNQRSSLAITGVVTVNSFDENIIITDTQEGILTIKGKDLHVSRLTLEKGEADIEGRIDSLVYSEKKKIKHLFS